MGRKCDPEGARPAPAVREPAGSPQTLRHGLARLGQADEFRKRRVRATVSARTRDEAFLIAVNIAKLPRY